MDRTHTNNNNTTHQPLLPPGAIKKKELNMAKKKEFDKIFKSPYKEQIDEFLTQGKNYSEISRWLKEQGTTISRRYISNYHKEMFNFQEKAIQRYEEHNQKLEQATSKYHLEIKLIDKYLKEADKQLDISALSAGQLTIFISHLMKRKQELLKEDQGVNIQINNNTITTNPFKDLKEYEKELKEQIEEK